MSAVEEKLKFAVFFDYDNIEIGVKTTLHRELDVASILEGIKQRGEVVSKIAYGNWSQHPSATRAFTEYGVQMVQRDSTPRGDKNGADINLALDALEMAFTRDHINAFAIISGDSDFMALVNKLKQFNKRVYIVGGKQFTSTILQRNCHEFISYESLMDLLPSRSRRGGGRGPRPAVRSLPLGQALSLIDRALSALEVRDVQPQMGLLKSTMQQLDPAFSERDYGVSSFSALVEKLVAEGRLRVKTVDSHRVVERTGRASEEEDGETAGTSDEALGLLQEVLAANVDVLELGIPEREVEALMGAAEPDFDESDYGFNEFGELLNLAQDKGLLRTEATGDSTLRFFPGEVLHKPLEAKSEEPQAEAATTDGEEEAPKRSRSRRRRRRGSGRGRRPEDSEAAAPAESATLGQPAEAPAEVEPEPAAVAEAEEPRASDEAEPEPKPAAKKTARRKAAKKAAKKTSKRGARKTAAKTPAPSEE